jgi:hypothetical protein
MADFPDRTPNVLGSQSRKRAEHMTMRMKLAVVIAIAGGMVTASSAQDLTVHVVTNSASPKPMAGVAVQLFPQPMMPGKRKVIFEKSDQRGLVVFHNIDLRTLAWSVSIYNLATVGTDPVVILCRPENAQSQYARPTVTSLPADITIHVRKRGLGERLEYLFRGP